jgi:hypothetical protein
VSIDDYAHILVERIAQDDIGCFSPNSSQGNQFLHGSWHLPTVPFDQSSARFLYAFGFVPEETCRFDRLLQIRW